MGDYQTHSQSAAAFISLSQLTAVNNPRLPCEVLMPQIGDQKVFTEISVTVLSAVLKANLNQNYES